AGSGHIRRSLSREPTTASGRTRRFLLRRGKGRVHTVNGHSEGSGHRGTTRKPHWDSACRAYRRGNAPPATPGTQSNEFFLAKAALLPNRSDGRAPRGASPAKTLRGCPVGSVTALERARLIGSVIADIGADLAAEHPIRPPRVHQDDRDQKQRAHQQKGLRVRRRRGF